MRSHINRRTCLRGTCALLGLPLLEAMLPRLLANDQTAKANVPQPRLLLIDEIGNGVDNVRWYPTKLGREWEITETLPPLGPFRDHMTVLSGLRQTYDDNGHLAADTFLTGGKAASNTSGSSVNLHGVQTTVVKGNAFMNGAPLRIVHTVGTPVTSVEGNAFQATPAPVFEELVFDGDPRVVMAGNVVDGQPVE